MLELYHGFECISESSSTFSFGGSQTTKPISEMNFALESRSGSSYKD